MRTRTAPSDRFCGEIIVGRGLIVGGSCHLFAVSALLPEGYLLTDMTMHPCA